MKNPAVESLTDQVWYHGILSREESDQLLEVDGDFLVRCSAINAKSDQYVLSCKWVSLLFWKNRKVQMYIIKDAQTLHFVIMQDQGKYLINEESSASFDSIPKLIDEFHSKKIPLSKLSIAVLRRPVSNFKKSSPKKPLRVPSIKNGIALGMVLMTEKFNF